MEATLAVCGAEIIKYRSDDASSLRKMGQVLAGASAAVYRTRFLPGISYTLRHCVAEKEWIFVCFLKRSILQGLQMCSAKTISHWKRATLFRRFFYLMWYHAQLIFTAFQKTQTSFSFTRVSDGGFAQPMQGSFTPVRLS